MRTHLCLGGFEEWRKAPADACERTSPTSCDPSAGRGRQPPMGQTGPRSSRALKSGWSRPPNVGAPSLGLDRIDQQPRSSADRFVLRPVLFERLSATAPGVVALVCAPAGSGKTLLLRSWAAELHEPVAWLTYHAGATQRLGCAHVCRGQLCRSRLQR